MTMEGFGEGGGSRVPGRQPSRSIQDPDDRSSYVSDPYGGASSHNNTDLVSTLLEQIRMLEARLVNNDAEHGQSQPFDVGLNASLHEEFGNPPSDGMRNPVPAKRMTIIPEVRKCSLADFKNRFGKEDTVHAVDVLVSGPLLQQEIEDELKLRQEHTFKRKSKGRGKPSKNKGVHFEKPAANLVDRAVHNKQSESTWPQRIRIQSPAILSILARAVNESWTPRPRTFFRPFSTLIYFHERMREALRELEQRWGHLETATPVAKDGGSSAGAPLDEQQYHIDDSPEALKEMRCYVKFMDREIMPLQDRFKDCTSAFDTKVGFDDLWYLFRTGDLVYLPISSESEKISPMATRQLTWRVYGIRPPAPRYRATPNDHTRYSNPAEMDDDNSAFILFCYYIDYTGDEFCVIRDNFKILPYEGECLVSQLSVYPFRFVPNHQKVLSNFTRIGRDFLRYINVKHSTYNWWTITIDPKGNPTTDEDGTEIKHPEHVNSEVIVDFVEAFQTCPTWKPQPAIIKPADPDSTTTADDFFIKCWADNERSKLLSESTEIIQLRGGVNTWERNKYITEDEFLCKVRENDKTNSLTTAECLREEDLALLPIRVFAYVLQDRKFVQLDVQKLHPVKESFNAFECLKISPRYKQTIQALVEAHFMKKSSEKEAGVEGMTQDLIQGKGKGLFILLHGVPGVGKTATAEAVAQANGKPLFSITCGDLGLTPKDVETALRGIFRLAHNWDCVLLLDEVDTFFSQRSKADINITKNALVSVFLRVLEYYNGILFLTTNRPGSLDEAFKSRIHLKLYYPPLSQKQTCDIWLMNIERLKAIEEQRCLSTGDQQLLIYEEEIMNFAMSHFANNPEGKGRWNGRQIRNAFQIAASLAYYDARKKYMQLKESNPDQPPLRPKLDVEHFQLMSNITGHFDEYMERAVGMSGSRVAAEMGDRIDDFRFMDSTDGLEDMYSPSSGGFSPDGRRVYGGMRGMSGYQGYGMGMPSGQRYSQNGRLPPRQAHIMDYDGEVAGESLRAGQGSFGSAQPSGPGVGAQRLGVKPTQSYPPDHVSAHTNPPAERESYYGNAGHEGRKMGYTPGSGGPGGPGAPGHMGEYDSPGSPPVQSGYFVREPQGDFGGSQGQKAW